jgi:hypothetical protein
VLVTGDGGRWRLVLDPEHARLLSRRVAVTGISSSLNMLDITSISLVVDAPM